MMDVAAHRTPPHTRPRSATAPANRPIKRPPTNGPVNPVASGDGRGHESGFRTPKQRGGAQQHYEGDNRATPNRPAPPGRIPSSKTSRPGSPVLSVPNRRPSAVERGRGGSTPRSTSAAGSFAGSSTRPASPPSPPKAPSAVPRGGGSRRLMSPLRVPERVQSQTTAAAATEDDNRREAVHHVPLPVLEQAATTRRIEGEGDSAPVRTTSTGTSSAGVLEGNSYQQGRPDEVPGPIPASSSSSQHQNEPKQQQQYRFNRGHQQQRAAKDIQSEGPAAQSTTPPPAPAPVSSVTCSQGQVSKGTADMYDDYIGENDVAPEAADWENSPTSEHIHVQHDPGQVQRFGGPATTAGVAKVSRSEEEVTSAPRSIPVSSSNATTGRNERATASSQVQAVQQHQGSAPPQSSQAAPAPPDATTTNGNSMNYVSVVLKPSSASSTVAPKLFRLTLRGDCSQIEVQSIKQALSDFSGIAVDLQRLTKDGITLHNRMTGAEFGLRAGSVLYLDALSASPAKPAGTPPPPPASTATPPPPAPASSAPVTTDQSVGTVHRTPSTASAAMQTSRVQTPRQAALAATEDAPEGLGSSAPARGTAAAAGGAGSGYISMPMLESLGTASHSSSALANANRNTTMSANSQFQYLQEEGQEGRTSSVGVGPNTGSGSLSLADGTCTCCIEEFESKLSVEQQLEEMRQIELSIKRQKEALALRRRVFSRLQDQKEETLRREEQSKREELRRLRAERRANEQNPVGDVDDTAAAGRRWTDDEQEEPDPYVRALGRTGSPRSPPHHWMVAPAPTPSPRQTYGSGRGSHWNPQPGPDGGAVAALQPPPPPGMQRPSIPATYAPAGHTYPQQQPHYGAMDSGEAEADDMMIDLSQEGPLQHHPSSSMGGSRHRLWGTGFPPAPGSHQVGTGTPRRTISSSGGAGGMRRPLAALQSPAKDNYGYEY